MRPGDLTRFLRWRLRQENGFAVPTALMALIASFGLASVAVISTVDVQQGTNQDHASKEAIAAADAGANVAMLRLNRFVSRLTAATPCVGPSGESQTPTNGWCPSSPAETAGGATYSYSVSAYSEAAGIQVVSKGTSGRTTRRVAVSMLPEPGKNVFEGEHLIGEKGIEFGGDVTIKTDMGTNGNVTKNGNGSGSICGNERIGIGKLNQEGTTVVPGCGVITEGNKALPPVVPPANIATSNSNCRLAGNCANGEADTWTKKTGWSESARELELNGNATVTMGGENYWFCKLVVKAGTIIIPFGAHVHIYIDTPEHCGLSSGATQVELEGGGIKSSGFNPQQGFYEVPGIFLVGNGAVNLGGNSNSNEMVLYAPLSKVSMKGTSKWIGMLAGKEMSISGTPTIEANEKIKPPSFTYPALLQRTRYVECSGTATTPNAGC